MLLYSTLPIIAFFLLFLQILALQSINETRDLDHRKALIHTGLTWSAFLVVGTELLSLLRGLTTSGFVFLWSFLILLIGTIHWRYKFISIGWKRLKESVSTLKLEWFDKFSFMVIVIALLILLITGVMSPPNIHDVLAYHMSRVMHWAQNQSLAFYPTSITWQLWMPPFSEFSQLNWQLLSGRDILSSLHQWYSLVLTMVAISAIAKRLGVNRRGQWLSAMFVLSLPIVVLQASGAKNDIVLAFLVSALLFYVIEATVLQLTLFDWIAAGISVGLGVLTKGTFSFFVLPILVWLLVLMVKKAGWKKTLTFTIVGLSVVFLLNLGHWVRNTGTFGSPVSTGYENFLINARFGADVVVSNLSRHIAVQMNGKYGFINEAVQTTLTQIHSWIGAPLFDPKTTLGPAEFYYVPTREEVAGNPFHFASTVILFCVASLGLIQKKEQFYNLNVVLLGLSAFSGAIIFSAVFRWQTWSTRLFIPYYVFFAPVVGYVFGKKLSSIFSWFFAFLLVIVMINPLLNNYSRSFSWSAENRNSIWLMSRKGLLFANNQNIEGAVLELTHLMDISACRTFGLILRSNAPEYLLWATLTPEPSAYFLELISIDNHTSIHSSSGFDPCGVVLFEVMETRSIDEAEYYLTKRWQVGDVYPFSLYLKPAFSIEALE